MSWPTRGPELTPSASASCPRTGKAIGDQVVAAS
jgi:hypothetical protein